MKGTEFRRMRLELGFLKRAHIAEVLGTQTDTVRSWETGRRPVPNYARKFVVTAMHYKLESTQKLPISEHV